MALTLDLKRDMDACMAMELVVVFVVVVRHDLAMIDNFLLYWMMKN